MIYAQAFSSIQHGYLIVECTMKNLYWNVLLLLKYAYEFWNSIRKELPDRQTDKIGNNARNFFMKWIPNVLNI